MIAAGAVTLAAIWQAAWTASGASSSTSWLSTTYDGAKDLMPIYEGDRFLRSLHLPYLGQADLPGSDAPVTPPSPPPAKTPTKTPTKKSATKTTVKKVAKKSSSHVVKQGGRKNTGKP